MSTVARDSGRISRAARDTGWASRREAVQPANDGAHPYDLSPDGNRLMIKTGYVATSDADERPQIILVQNWFEELTRLVPTDP